MEEPIEELKTAKTKLATAEDELTEAKKELTDAKAKLATAEAKLATAQSEYDNQIDNLTPKTINKLERAQGVFNQCSDTVISIRAMFVTLNSTVLSLSAAAAPGKFER